MFGLTRETRVFLRTGATDLRLSFEGLSGLVVNVIRRACCGMAAVYGCAPSASSVARWRGLRANRRWPR